MPSDLAKKKAAKKKEAAKARQRSKKPDELNGEAEQPDAPTNGAESNGERKTEFLGLVSYSAFLRFVGVFIYMGVNKTLY